VWTEIEAEAAVTEVSSEEMLRRLTWAGLYLRKRVRQDGVDVIFEHPNGDRERLLLDPDRL
jgi:hypothetical protein